MGLIINPFRLIQRIRHAYGFSVHSPFAFNLILDTIHTPHSYYIYEQNRTKINIAGLLKNADFKYAELLFRLTNRFNAKEILEIGSGFGINTLYISAHSKQTTIRCVEKDDEKIKIAQKLLVNNIEKIVFNHSIQIDTRNIDAVYWDLKLFPLQSEEILDNILNSIKPEGFLVLNHINLNKHNKQVWQKICDMETLTMSFDLGTIGIGFFKTSLPKMNYDVYF